MQDVFRAIGRLSAEHRHGADHRRDRAPARNSSRARCTSTARARAARSSRSTPRRSRRTCSSPNCSATSAAPSPARRRRGAAASSRPTAARCSSTRSATCRSTCRRACCACCRDGQFYRVGGHNPLRSNVRVIAATHQNLEERVKAGAFREDLFHRLNVIRLRLPALRERREDMPPLTRFFLQKSAQRARRRGQAHHRRGAGAADGSSTSPATCASSRTSATG